MYLTDSLFSAKEMYLAISRTNSGRDILTDSLPLPVRREYVYNNRHIACSLPFDNWFPSVQPYEGPLDFEVVPFNQRKKASGKGQAVHFFLNDYVFRRAMWDKLEKTVLELSKFDVVFAPDFSMWLGVPDFDNVTTVYKNRIATSYMQKCGFNTIPVASFADANSFSYCFKGLPQKSVIALCGIGHLRYRELDALWRFAVEELQRQLNPSHIIIYGPEVSLPRIEVPVTFIKDFITTKLRTL